MKNMPSSITWIILTLAFVFTGCTDKKAGQGFSGKNESAEANKTGGNPDAAGATVEQTSPDQQTTPNPEAEPQPAASKTGPCAKATVAQVAGGTPVTVRNVASQQKAELCGEKLSLIGSGVRVRAGDRYVLTAYSKTKTCDPQALINTDEPKYLKIDVIRDTSADLVSEAIGEALLANLPPNTDAALRAKIDSVIAAFTIDFTVGLKVDMVYHPDIGNSFRMDGKPEQIIAGKEVAKILWSSFFGDATCCATTKTEILTYCAQNP